MGWEFKVQGPKPPPVRHNNNPIFDILLDFIWTKRKYKQNKQNPEETKGIAQKPAEALVDLGNFQSESLQEGLGFTVCCWALT